MDGGSDLYIYYFLLIISGNILRQLQSTENLYLPSKYNYTECMESKQNVKFTNVHVGTKREALDLLPRKGFWGRSLTALEKLKSLREKSRESRFQRFRPSSGSKGPPSPSQRRPRSGKPGRACSKNHWVMHSAVPRRNNSAVQGVGRGSSRLSHCLSGRPTGRRKAPQHAGYCPGGPAGRAGPVFVFAARACSRPRAVPARATYPAGPGCTS